MPRRAGDTRAAIVVGDRLKRCLMGTHTADGNCVAQRRRINSDGSRGCGHAGQGQQSKEEQHEDGTILHRKPPSQCVTHIGQ
jgi:hypothetical protein